MKNSWQCFLCTRTKDPQHPPLVILNRRHGPWLRCRGWVWDLENMTLDSFFFFFFLFSFLFSSIATSYKNLMLFRNKLVFITCSHIGTPTKTCCQNKHMPLSCIHTYTILGYKVTEQDSSLDSNPLLSVGSTAFFFPSGSGPVEHRTTARRCSSKENSSVSFNLFFKMSFQNSQNISDPNYYMPQSKRN